MSDKRKTALIELFAWLTFIIFVVGGLVFGSIILTKQLLPALGVNMDANIKGSGILVFLIGACFTIAVLVYLSVIMWLVFSRFVFSSMTVWKIARHSHLLKFDRWIIRTIVGDEPNI